MTEHMTKTQVAVATGRTLFPNKVKSVSDGLGKTERVIKRSANAKLGKTVSKGKLAGFPIYTVTLEERSTCTNACVHWANCYGNNMPFATRYAADDALIAQMETELATLQKKHPNGFLVRLHVLGDFFSVAYVAKWGAWLGQFPALHVYGYTHHKRASDIGGAVQTLDCDRWRVRVSGDTADRFAALSYDQPEAVEQVERKAAFICPVQTDKVDTCGACSLCWTTRKAVVFITH